MPYNSLPCHFPNHRFPVGPWLHWVQEGVHADLSEGLDTSGVEDVRVFVNHEKEVHDVAIRSILFFESDAFSRSL